MQERISAVIVGEVDKASFQKAETEASAQLKRLNSNTGIFLRTKVTGIQNELQSVRSRIKRAERRGDFNARMNLKLEEQALKAQLRKASSSLRNFADRGKVQLSGISGAFNGIIGSVGKLALVLGAGLGATQLGKSILFLGDKLEQANISFTTMLGSAEKAQDLLADLSQFAANTPFEVLGLRDTTKQLLAFGIEQKKLLPTLKALGDVSAGLSVPIEQIAYAYGQVRSANQLYGTELRQFVNAGVPILQELADMFGVTAGEAKKMVEDGEVSFTDVEEAFARMTGEGGRFFNLMDKQSKTLSGKWSNLKDNLTIIGERIGTALIPTFKGIIDGLNSMIVFVEGVFQGAVGQAFIEIGSTILSTFQDVFKTFGEIFRGIQDILGLSGQDAIQWQYVFAGASLGIVKSIKFLQLGLKNLFDFTKFIFTGIPKIAIESFQVLISAGVLAVKALGESFLALPRLIDKGVKLGLNKAFQGINTFLQKINGVFGTDFKLDFEFNVPQGGAFKNTAKEFDLLKKQASDVAKVTGEALGNFSSSIRSNVMDYSAGIIESERRILGALNKRPPEQRKINTELEITRDTTKDTEEATKKGTQAVAEQAKEYEKMREEQEKLNKVQEKRKDIARDNAESINRFLKQEIDAQKELMSTTQDEIEELKDSLESINDVNIEIAEKFADVTASIKELKEEQKELGDVQSIEKTFNALGGDSFDTSTLGDDTQVGGLGVTGEQIKEFARLREEIEELNKEATLLQSQTTSQDIENAQLSDAEKLIQQKEEIGNEEDINSRIATLEAEKQEQQLLLEGFQKAFEFSEKQITDTAEQESASRLEIYKREAQTRKDLLGSLAGELVASQKLIEKTGANGTSSNQNITNNVNLNGLVVRNDQDARNIADMVIEDLERSTYLATKNLK